MSEFPEKTKSIKDRIRIQGIYCIIDVVCEGLLNVLPVFPRPPSKPCLSELIAQSIFSLISESCNGQSLLSNTCLLEIYFIQSLSDLAEFSNILLYGSASELFRGCALTTNKGREAHASRTAIRQYTFQNNSTVFKRERERF